jgi:hypothetical protein
MKLVHNGQVLGTITSVSKEGVWMSGALSLASSVADSYRRFFAFMTDENNHDKDPPFGPDLLDETQWFVEEADGSRRGIEIPAIHADGAIDWRWR